MICGFGLYAGGACGWVAAFTVYEVRRWYSMFSVQVVTVAGVGSLVSEAGPADCEQRLAKKDIISASSYMLTDLV